MKTEAPVAKEKTAGSFKEEVSYVHPAFGTIAATRSNGRSVLFDTKVDVDGFVSITIHEAELIRGPYGDRVYGHGKRVIEVLLSETQWVGFISRMNIGGGVPCTLRYRQTGPMIDVPGISRMENLAERLNREANSIADNAEKVAKERLDEIDAILETLPKGKAEKIRNLLELVTVQTFSNMDYGRKTLTEHAEKTVTEASIEINAKVQGMVTQLGIERLSDLLLLAGKKEDGDTPAIE